MPIKRKHDPGYKLPEVINPDTCCICIPIPNDFNHKMAFLGQLDELGYWWNWERDPGHKGTEAAQVWRSIVQCIREDLNMSDCGCGDDKPTNTRINPDTGLYEVSYDGGLTWELDPASDPRSSGTIFPPLPGDSGATLRCQAANSAVGFFEDLQGQELEQLEANASVADIITGLIGALSGIGLIFAFVPAAIAALLAFVVNKFAHMIAEDFDGEFTGATWDDLLCILYCTMEDDGSFTEAQWQFAKDQCITTIGDYAGYWLSDHINLVGVVGLTNAARAGYPGTRDCEACLCDPCLDCTEFAWTGSEVLVTPASANVIWIGGVTLEGSGYLRCDNGEGVEFLFDEPICIDSFRMPCARGVNPTINAKIVFNDDPVAYTIDPLTGVAYTGVPSIGYVHALTTPKEVFSIKITCDSNGANPSQFFIHGIELHACADA